LGELALLLSELEKRLREYDAPIARVFRPGANPQCVRATLSAAGLESHDDLVVWWGWHDGAEAVPPGSMTSATTSLISPWFMPTLEDAIRLRRERHQILRQAHEEYGAASAGALFPQSWLPVVTTELGSDLCADTAAAGPAPLHTISKEVEVSLNHFESLSEFVQLILDAFEKGLVEFHARAPDLLTFVWDELPPNMRRLATWP
jgi:hypothetical protein